MARGVNKVILVGNLGKDPEVRYSPNGNAVANITIATSEQWKDRNSGEQQEKTEWHRVVFFNRLAEIVGEYLKKGSQVYICGRLQTRSWDDKDGVKRWATEIVARDVIFLDSQSQKQDRPPTPPAEDKPATGGYNPKEEGGGGGGADYEQQDHGGYSEDVPF